VALGLLTEHGFFIVKAAALSFRTLGTCKSMKRPYVPKELNPQQNSSTNLRLF
jgi:hypothetical protein